ncbi:hypothetical protein SUGI_0662920 [Cryptomeria japonica]|uniref:G-type lectin S-receptor-like serine/threonine-protein kinase At2g19130 n=1 Tax=Cryptomeria japonica TaxID=3369 RepID=UPI0024147218|nr:G-type lectin S-receptor-like serine/threonine-protein kinase At2g19130 [Cryptomeria japonica]GLJ32909.1 hypothetical protein SUGI_0662920 [Cryptomeria japonica]
MDSPLSQLFHLLPAFLAVAALKLCHGADTLYAGESLTGNQTRISNNGTFELGFFQPPGSTKWYIGIWVAQISEQSVVWVANRENPLENNAGLFTLTRAGNLAVFDEGGACVWSGQGTDRGSRATLQENGNFVVLNGKGSTVWESSRQPGNTLLPGMKIIKGQKLISWKSTSDPAPGPFTLELDPSGPGKFVLLWKESIRYWDSGDWNGQFFSRLPEMATKYVYDFSFVNNRTDTFFTYSLTPGVRLLTRFVLDQVGDVRLYTWINDNNWNMFWSQPQDQCQIYDFCGTYGICRHNDNIRFCNCLQGFEPRDSEAWNSQHWSGGCARKTPLHCNGESADGFLELQGGSLPEPGRGDISLENRTREDCQSACRSNCSCVAFSYTASKSCRMWSGNLLNLSDDVDDGKNYSVFIRLAEADLPQKFKTHGRSLIETLVAVSGCLAVMGVVFLVGFLCWRSGPEKYKDNVPGSLRMFTYKELQIATRSFSERLGGGGFGSVYKGVLPDKTPVAVKALEGSSQGEKQFRMEVSTIGTIQHVNLVRLRGFCTEGSNRMLVYDYMPNGSLNSLLFPKPKTQQKVLEWNTRFEIALGTARGILYLHEKCRDCIIHCDIKPENILLDAELIPKVADFGLAKLVGHDFTHVLTTMRGTRGYLAPEWISGTPITAKADVYSFGMTLLEIISGRRNLDFSAPSSKLFYPTWAGSQMKLGNMTDLLDVKLNSNADMEQLRRAALVGGWCIQDDEDARPTMAHVVNVLEGIVDIVDIPPIPRSLQLLMEQGEGGGAAHCDFLFSEKALMMKKHLYKETPTNAV